MKIKAKHILLTGLAAVVGFSIWGGKKAVDTYNVAEKLTIALRGISSFPEFFGATIRTSVNIAIQNPTPTPLNIETAGLVKLKQIRVFNKQGKLAGVANPNLEALQIPAYGEIVIKKVPIESSIQGLLNTILIGSTNIDDYRIESDIEALGKIITV